MNILLIIYFISLIIATVYGIYALSRNGIHLNNSVVLYLSVATLIEALVYVLNQFGIEQESITLIYKCFFVFCSIFLSILYFRKTQGLLSLLIAIIAIGFYTYLIFTTQLFNKEFGTTFGVMISLQILITVIFWFANKLKEPAQYKITQDPFFWYSTGFLIWSSMFALRILPANFLQTSDISFLKNLQQLNIIASILNYIFVVVGFRTSMKYYNQWNQ